MPVSALALPVYVETYERSLPKRIEINPADRVLAEGESQAYRVTAHYEDGTTADVSPSSVTDEANAELLVYPQGAATVHGNVITVAAGTTGVFNIQARYRDSGMSMTTDATVTVGMSSLVELIPSPESMSVIPGVFRSISYYARYDDGYETEVTSQVDLTVDRPEDVQIAGQSVKVNLTAPPGALVVTGTYVDGHGDQAQAITDLTSYGLKTQWERYRVSGGGGGRSAAWSQGGSQMAWGSTSGAVSLYDVGPSPSQCALKKVFIAHDSPVVFTDYIGQDILLTVSEDGSIKTWNLIGSVTQSLTIHSHDAPILCAARNGAKLAFGDSLGRVGLFDTSVSNLDWTVETHNGSVRSVAIDGSRVLSGGDDWRVKVLQRSDGAELHEIFTHSAPVISVGFFSTASFFAVSEDETADFWRSTDFEILTRYEFNGKPTWAEVINGQLYLGTTGPVATSVYNTDGLLLSWLAHSPNEGMVCKYLIDPSGKYLLTGRKAVVVEVTKSDLFGEYTEEKLSGFSAFQFWEAGRGIFRGSLAHSHPLETVSYNSANLTLFSQDDKRTIKWTFSVNDATTESTNLLETGYFLDQGFSGFDMTANGGILGTRVGVSIYLYDTLSDRLWKTLHTPGVGPFAISPLGTRLASSDSKTRLWDLSNLSQINEESRVSQALDFIDEGDFVGGVGGDNIIGIWNSSGLMYNAMQTTYSPVRVIVNTTGTRCAAVTMNAQCDLFNCIYNYYLEVFDISDPSQEPIRVTSPLFLLQTNKDLFFGGGEGVIGTSVGVSDDAGLVLIGSEGDRPVRLISTADGAVLREFDPPSGRGKTNLGSSAVGFADNDSSLLIGWREGFAELYRRVPPTSLSVSIVRTSSRKGGSLLKTTVIDGGEVYVFPGDTIEMETFASYANGSDLNVTAVASLTSSNSRVAPIDGRVIRIPLSAQFGATSMVSVRYEELETELLANFQVIVGEDPSTFGDTNQDGSVDPMDLFEFSTWWYEDDARDYSPCDRVDDEKVDSQDLFWLFKYWR